MKFRKSELSESGHPERARSVSVLLAGVVIGGALFHASCRRTSDPGFDIVPVSSVAYLPASARAMLDGGPSREAGTRDGGGATVGVKCDPPPDDDFEPSDEVEECPATNDVGWDLEPDMTKRRRARDQDVCCYKRGPVRVPEEE